VLPENADLKKGTQFTTTPAKTFLAVGNESYIGYKQLDLTDIGHIDILAQATTRVGAIGGLIEVRLDSPTGPVVGKTPMVKVSSPTLPGAATATTQRPVSATATAAGTTPASTSAAAPAGATPDRAAMMRRMSQKVTADITPTTGMHTVYFVFTNPQAAADQVLMQSRSIQFVPTGQAASAGTGH
jgi:cytochrome c